MPDLRSVLTAILGVLLRTVAIMSGVGALAFGILLIYRASQGQPVAPGEQLVMLGGFAVIAFVTSMTGVWLVEHRRVVQLDAHILEIQASKPKVGLAAGRHSLTLTNRGGPARFRARIRVVECHHWDVAEGPWQALWQRSRTDEAEIFRNEQDAILLASVSPTEGQPPEGRLALNYFNLSKHEPASLSTTYTLESETRPRLRLQVSIFSDPEPETPVVREMELAPDGISLLS
jgi:hypothetical protein